MTRPAAPRTRGRRAPLARPLRRWLADDRGAAIVEFAIVVPVLLVLVTGIIDFARMMAVAASLSAAARDGARQYAAASSLDDPALRNAARDRVIQAFQPMGGAALGSGGSGGTVTVNHDNAGNVVVTIANYRYVPITPVAKLVGLGEVRFSRTATFRWERSQ